ncbi:unnamed protein product [Rotaria sp. Silwood1]|nr:unnamed protein product [Rotaria sp. Silwood1]
MKLSAGSKPISVASGYFNDDTKLDIVVVNSASNDVSVFLGYSNIGFVKEATFITSNDSRLRSLVIGDFNNDDRMDIGVTYLSLQNIQIFLGYGNFSFVNQATYTTSLYASPSSMAVGDFNNDSRLDVVLTYYLSENIGILLGYGNGSFTNETTYSTDHGSYPYYVAVADFNNDNMLDIIIANQGSNNVGIFLGYGNGEFASSSPANSGTVESVFFDEPTSQKIIVQELTTPETIKLDLLIQTKTLIEKMKSFITLMDANQLSLAEQKQVYENIKEDYEKLLKTFDQTKHNNDLNDIDFDADINQELETMKQLLKEIVKRITDNLLGKSNNNSEPIHLTREESHLSQLSTQSSLCNQADLMDQYKKILNAMNTDIVEKKTDIKSLQVGSKQMKKNTSRNSSQSDISNHLSSTTKNQKPYVYVSGDSDDEQQQNSDTTSVPLINGLETTLFRVDHIPSTSNKHHQQINEEQTHIRGITTTKKRKSPSKQIIQQYDNLENISNTKRKFKTESKKIKNNYQSEKELTPSSLSMPTGTIRYSASSMRTRTSDYDSGIGTNNTTKLSRDSKLNTSTIDESHYQSLDEERRRYSDEEQESISNLSSSRSSGSGAASPGSPYNKYTKRFDRSLSLKQLNENRRRKPSGHSDRYPSDIETHITGSFDTFPQSTLSKKKSHLNWQPKRTTTHRSRLTSFHRSLSNDSINIDNYKTRLYRPQTAPQLSSKTVQYYKMSRKYQSGFIHQPTTKSLKQSETMYKSSCYINQAHTHRKSQEKLNQNLRQYQKPIQILNKQQTNNLYLDPQTGIIYRYVQDNTKPYYQPTSQTKASQQLYRCTECGSITTYYHRHHMNSTTRRVKTDLDDPGYESGNRKVNRYRRYIDHLSSSESDSDDNPTYCDTYALNEAYERAKKVQEHSQNLSKYISRQLKLVLATI